MLASSIAMGLAAAGCLGTEGEANTGAEPQDQASAKVFHERQAYAEKVYGDYQAAAKGRIAFELTTLGAGTLSELADRSVNEIVGVPGSWIQMNQRATEILDVRSEPRNPEEDEWSAPVSLRGFEELGLPVAEGSFRLLSIQVGLGRAESAHQALEVCWAAQDHCIIMDPVVLQLDAFSQNRRALLTAGLAPMKGEEAARMAAPEVLAAGACTLNSHPTWTAAQIDYPAWGVDYKNVFGITLVHKDIGKQQAGIACYVASDGSCKSSGYGFSNTSNCFANLGYTCDCDNTGNQIGLSPDGVTIKAWSETKCAHRLVLNADVSWTVEGVGSGFSIRWETSGSVDSNGGQFFDSCSRH
jgi:hypothetical protein